MSLNVTFNLDGYPIGVMLSISSTKEEMIAAASENGCSTATCLKDWHWVPSKLTMGHCAVLPCHRVILWFRSAEPTAATLAHESFHAAYGVLPQLGIRLSHATEEVFAYAIDNLVRQLSERLAHIRTMGVSA